MTSPLVLIRLEFSDVDVFLLFHVSLVVTKAQHAFHQQSHCVNYKHEEHCTSFAEGFHRVNTGFWCANWWAAWLRGFIFMKLLRDQDWGLKEMYIMCIWSVLHSQVKIRMYIHHLMDGWIWGVIYEHIDCLCLQQWWTDICCRNQKQTVRNFPAIYIQLSFHTYNPAYTQTDDTHPAASCSVWRETHFKKRRREEWPHLYVHSVCTVSSESVRPQLL